MRPSEPARHLLRLEPCPLPISRPPRTFFTRVALYVLSQQQSPLFTYKPLLRISGIHASTHCFFFRGCAVLAGSPCRRCAAAVFVLLLCGSVRAPCSCSFICLSCLRIVRPAISPRSLFVPCTCVLLLLLQVASALLLLLLSSLL